MDNQTKFHARVTEIPSAAPTTNQPMMDKPTQPKPDSLKPDLFGADTDGMRARMAMQKKKRKRRRFRLFLLFCVTVAIASVVGWQWWIRANAKTVEPTLKTTEVVRRDFASSVLATGAVKPQIGAEVRVGARISGKVERLRSNIGDAVTLGQVIAELEKDDLIAIVAQRRAELELAQAKLAAVESLLPKEIEKAALDIQRWQATLSLSEKNLKRMSQLVKKRAVSQEDFDEAIEQLDVAKAQVAFSQKAHELTKSNHQEQLRQAKADVQRATSALKNAEVQQSYATLTAPIAGVIGSVSTQEGETVAAGLNSPTFVTIIDLKRLQVEAMVDEVDIGKVHPGQKATFTVDSFPAREFPGIVVAIYPKAILLENVVYYDVVVDIQGNDDEVLRPDMTASVTIFLDKKTDVLAVPVKAVKREQGKNVVYVMEHDQPQPREVKVGWKDGTWIEIRAGLEEGQTILTEPPEQKTAKL